MSTFYFIRHGAHDWLDRGFAGRQPGVHLNSEGMRQAAALPERLVHIPFTTLYSSPLERARETAAPLAAQRGMPVRTVEQVVEIDVGEWAGKTFAELRESPGWHEFKAFRSGTSAPGGETMLEVQARMVAFMRRAHAEQPEGHLAVFGHGDPIRSALLFALGSPLDMLFRLEVSPISVNVIQWSDSGPRVLCVNSTEGVLPPP